MGPIILGSSPPSKYYTSIAACMAVDREFYVYIGSAGPCTHQQRAGGQDDVRLNKLPQTMVAFAAKVLLCVTYICTLAVDV